MIYFIAQKNELLVKIGYTAKMQDRLISLQTANPEKLNLLLLLPGEFDLEKKIHFKFRKFRHNNEWFYLSNEIKRFINNKKINDVRIKENFSDNKTTSLRISNNLNLRQMGEKLQMTAQSIKEIEERELTGRITIKTLKKYASVLGYKFEYDFIKISDI